MGSTKTRTAYHSAIGARLRATRMALGLSLRDVEERSRGRWKAVVVGSYERADRSLTPWKLAELARWYGVPVMSLLPEEKVPPGAAETVALATAIRRARIGAHDGRQAVRAARRLLATLPAAGEAEPDASQGPEAA